MNKLLAFALSILFSVNGLAADVGSIEIFVNDGSTVKIEWLGEEVDASEVEAAWDMGGSEALIAGQLCYNGNADDVTKILYSLRDFDFLGDEFWIQNVTVETQDQIRFEIYDGPNEIVHTEVAIKTCSHQ